MDRAIKFAGTVITTISTMADISVVIPSYRNPTYLDLCLRSLTENAMYLDKVEAIVVLDGYADESRAVLAKYPDVNVLEFDENRGQMVAHNLGVMHATSQWILIVNDDNVFPILWDERLAAVAGLFKDTIYTPNQIEPTKSIFRSFIQQDFGVTPETFRYDDFMEFEQKHSTSFRGQFPYTEDGGTWPILFEKRHYMMLGGIDQNYPSAAVADWDFFLRAELAGLRLKRYHELCFYHFAGASTRKKNIDWNAGEAQSFEYFQYKWGFLPPTDWFTHSHFPVEDIVRGVQFHDPMKDHQI
jgi:GT2 family glycosyltransferase